MQVCQLGKNEPAHQSNICFTINVKIKPNFFFFRNTHKERERDKVSPGCIPDLELTMQIKSALSKTCSGSPASALK